MAARLIPDLQVSSGMTNHAKPARLLSRLRRNIYPVPCLSRSSKDSSQPMLSGSQKVDKAVARASGVPEALLDKACSAAEQPQSSPPLCVGTGLGPPPPPLNDNAYKILPFGDFHTVGNPELATSHMGGHPNHGHRIIWRRNTRRGSESPSVFHFS